MTKPKVIFEDVVLSGDVFFMRNPEATNTPKVQEGSENDFLAELEKVLDLITRMKEEVASVRRLCEETLYECQEVYTNYIGEPKSRKDFLKSNSESALKTARNCLDSLEVKKAVISSSDYLSKDLLMTERLYERLFSERIELIQEIFEFINIFIDLGESKIFFKFVCGLDIFRALTEKLNNKYTLYNEWSVICGYGGSDALRQCLSFRVLTNSRREVIRQVLENLQNTASKDFQMFNEISCKHAAIRKALKQAYREFEQEEEGLRRVVRKLEKYTN